VPVAKAVVLVKAVPPADAAYHFIAVPVATKFATVADVQNVCADAIGAVIGVIVTAAAVLTLSQVPVV
jgi:hypothetical protein